MREGTTDIGIMGGGPAGAFAALVLCRAGCSVTMVDAATARPRIEGLSPRVVALLARHGIDPGALGIGPRAVRQALWNGAVETGNGEFLVERAAFDAALRRVAAAEGVTVVTDSVVRIDSSQEGAARIVLRDGAPLIVRRAIDARGRRAPVAAGRMRGPATLTVGGWIASGGLGRPVTMTVPAPDGWLWHADFGDGRAWLQASLDGRAEAGGADLRGRVADLLGSDEARAAFPQGIPCPENLLVRNADTVLAQPDLDPGHIRIGDAAVGLDPLSGHGMFWAVSSALSLIPVLAALEDGSAGQADLARRFYRDRIVETFFRQARVGRDFYRTEGRFGARLFWAARQAWPDDEPSHAGVKSASIARAVVVEDNRLAEREIVRTPAHPAGVAFVAGIPIAPVVRRLRDLADGGCADLLSPDFLSPGASRDQAAALGAWLCGQGLIKRTRTSLMNGGHEA